MPRKKQFFLHCMLIASLIVALILPGNTESVFLKDGRIIEGTIVKETDRAMDVKLPDGKKVTIPRKEVLRTLVHDNYKTKMYIMKADKKVLPVYIVEEDNERYICRNELNSTEEFYINKSDVLFLSKIPPQAFIEDEAKKLSGSIKKEYTWEQQLKWRAPLLRAGLSVRSTYDSELEYLYPEEDANFFFDFFLWRFRNQNGNGLDLMVRLRAWQRNADFPFTDERTPLFQQLWNVTISSDKVSSDTAIEAIGAGIRYAYTFYAGITIQPYVFVLGQWVRCSPIIFYSDGIQSYRVEKGTSSFGYQIGAGIDFGLWTYVGVFVEYALGYATLEFPNGKKYNGDGQFVYVGASFRTSYGLIE